MRGVARDPCIKRHSVPKLRYFANAFEDKAVRLRAEADRYDDKALRYRKRAAFLEKKNEA